MLVAGVALAFIAKVHCDLRLCAADSNTWLGHIIYEHAWEGGALIQLRMACRLRVD